ESRTKEIGVHKVHGAGAWQITRLLLMGLCEDLCYRRARCRTARLHHPRGLADVLPLPDTTEFCGIFRIFGSLVADCRGDGRIRDDPRGERESGGALRCQKQFFLWKIKVTCDPHASNCL